MDMTGEQHIAAPRQTVWDGLNDLAILKDCIPGCETIEKISDSEHHVTLTAAVGPVKAKFKGKMHLEDMQPPQSYGIRFEGQGGVAGFAKGEAQVSLEEVGATTAMRYKVHAQVGGKLAQIGSRLVDAAAKKTADDFFTAFNARVAPPAAEAGAKVSPGGAVAAAAAKAGGGLPAWVWVGAGILALVAIYYLVLR